MDPARRLSFRSAAELTGVPTRTLRRHVRDGHLRAEEEDGRAVGVTLASLDEAGLLGEHPGGARPDSRGGNGGSLEAPLAPGDGTWVPAGQTQELVRRLLAEREMLGAEWKETTQGLFREIIEEQRERIARLEEEKGGLTADLRDALRKIPKLMELEELESHRDRLAAELSAEGARARAAEEEVQRCRSEIERLERDRADAERRRVETEETLRRLRARGVWSRLVDREPR